MRGVSMEKDWEGEVKMGWPPSVVAEAVRAVWPVGIRRGSGGCATRL